jgi:hypothetical protein
MASETTARPTDRAMKAAVEMEIHAACSTMTIAKGAALDEAFPAYDDMLAALRLGVEYDDLLLRFKGPRILYDGDVKEVDAAFDRWVAATRAAIAKAR